ncbi:unnamed protein product [Echinostoma caproni]|uniref:Cadherin domain protein n=1 Tax=Echinostoma caproni TaxID=27848 RepID=A0A183A5G1_9TREM|nr:unnamed protein product [Echinostoma caproni]
MQYFGIRTISPTQAAIYVIQTPDVDAAPKTTFSDRNLVSQNELTNLAEKVGKRFTFHAIVRDNGYPRQLSARTEVTVLVLDVNDMPPSIFVSYLTTTQTGNQHSSRLDFGRAPTPGERNHGQVKENSDRAFIAFVTVQDFDSGVWGQVRCFTNNDAFELIPVNEAPAGAGDSLGQFIPLHQSVGGAEVGVGETGFKLLATKPFDREQTSEVSFHIICVDNPQYIGSSSANYENPINPYFTSQSSYGPIAPTAGTVQLTGTALVRVVIIDENDNIPKFSRTQYSFIMDEADGSVVRGHLMLTSDSQLFVGRVSASDQDSTSQVIYSLAEDLLSQFRIEPESGKIFALHQFDREDILLKVKQGEYPQTDTLRAEVEGDKLVYLHFGVMATDGLHNSTAKVRLLIRDVNDNPPVFSKSQYEFVVSENEQPIQSGSIGAVEAHDMDADANAQIVYQIYDVTDPSAIEKSTSNNGSRVTRFTTNMLFTISAKSGQLHLIRKLDREKQSHHIFYVLAIDNPREGHTDRTWQTGNQMDSTAHSTKSHTSTATVTVIVADVNDNAPIITYPTPHGVINVESGAPAGHNLFTVVAHDPDAGENGTVRFTLSMANFDRSGQHLTDLTDSSGRGEGEEAIGKSSSSASENSAKSGLFSIDATTGIVFVVEKITDQSANYLLVIGAHDLGRPQQRKTTTTVTVRAHNSQLLQALNTYRLGNRLGSPSSDVRHPRGPNLSSDGTNASGDQSVGNVALISHNGPDELRPQATGREAGVDTEFEPIDPSTLGPPSNNTTRLDQSFGRPKSGPLSRLDPNGPESGSCTMNSTGGAKPNEISILPHLHPIILHDAHTGSDELEHLEYGSPVYGKAGIYPGEPITLISSNDVS